MVTKKIKYFFNDLSDEEPLLSCLEQIFDYLFENNLTLRHILFATIFIKKRVNFSQYVTVVEKYLFKYNFDVPHIIVAQTPYNAEVAFEILFIEGDFRIVNYGDNFKIIDRSGFTELYFAKSSFSKHIFEASGVVFNDIYHLLRRYGIKIENIIRQWNYIENIYNKDEGNQNYQIFNEVRSTYYEFEKWRYGYPSATGIGTDNGGIGIAIIAIKPKNDVKIIPLKNPNQIDAHNYSENVLFGDSFKKSTPKFERGKVVINDKNIDIYISGTAAILGENTISENTIELQTKTTIENIFKLISTDNLKRNLNEEFHSRIENIDIKSKFSNIRVYVKNQEDIEIAQLICREAFGNIPIIVLKADICRENLSVEIEGNIFSLFE